MSRRGEDWADVRGFEGRYQISDRGRVLSLCGATDRILKPQVNNYGYPMISLWPEGGDKAKVYLIARLVLEHFHRPPYPGAIAIREHRTSIASDRARWGTQSEAYLKPYEGRTARRRRPL